MAIALTPKIGHTPYERRGEVQHNSAREVYAATLAVIEHAPNLLQDVGLQLKQRG